MPSTMLLVTAAMIAHLQAADPGGGEPAPFETRTAWLRAHVARALGESFSLHETDHFLVYYDRHPRWATRRAELLERTHEQYQRTMAEAGWQVHPIREKLVCSLFFHRAAYLDYARRTDRLEALWQNGH